MTLSACIVFASCIRVDAATEKKAPPVDWTAFRHSIVAAKPGTLKGFKGFEMYSWSTGATWHYSILPGTNRNKTANEVRESGITLTNLTQLESALGKLAPNCEVFWFNIVDGKTSLPEFSYPHQAVVNEVKKYADRRHIKLVTRDAGH